MISVTVIDLEGRKQFEKWTKEKGIKSVPLKDLPETIPQGSLLKLYLNFTVYPNSNEEEHILKEILALEYIDGAYISGNSSLGSQ